MKQLVITVHGIRTFGNWQERLEELLRGKAKDRDLTVINYKFGYFSVAAFIVPFFRWLVVRRFRRCVLDVCADGKWDRVDFVGHSFGTHIIAWGLYGIDPSKRPPVHTIILAGSVLNNYFQWPALLNRPVKRLVNDCGTRDIVLIFSQVLVPFTGMAGQQGFNGGTGENFRNRFFPYGHSDYFLVGGKADNAFMEKYWVPLLVSDAAPIMVDERKSSALGGIWLTLLNNAGTIKLAIWLTIVGVPTLLIWRLYVQARDNFVATDSLLSGYLEIVSESVQPAAQLKTAEALLKSTQDIIARLPIQSRDDPRIKMQEARAFILLAELKAEAGAISELRGRARQAYDLLKPIEPSADEYPEALHLLARSTALIARSYAQQDPQRAIAFDGQQAMRLYQEALAALRTLEPRFEKSDSKERDRAWLVALARTQREIGDLLLTDAFKKPDEARGYYAASVKTFEKLKQLWPDWTRVEFELGWAKNKYGDVLWRKGDAGALGQYQEAAKDMAPLVAAQLSQNLEWQHLLVLVQANIGSILRNQGHYEEALAAFEKAVKEVDRLTESDPGHRTWRATRAWIYDSIGETKLRWARRQQNENLLQGAGDKLNIAQTLRHQLVDEVPDNDRWRIDLAVSRANVAAYEGTVKEFKKEFIGAANDFDEAVRRNSVQVTDERGEPMALRTIEFREWAALDFKQGLNAEAADAQIRKAIELAREQVGTAVDRKVFEDKLDELEKLLKNP